MKTNFLTFLGRGNAFNYNEENTSAYLIRNNHFYLFDCGQKIATKIIHLGILKDINHVTIFITHLHPDHVASLSELLTYIILYFKEIKYEVIYKDKDTLSKLLNIFSYDFPVTILDNYSNDYLKIETIKQNHIENSYGYLVYTNELNFFYSGDTNCLSDYVLNLFKEGKINLLYHEVSLNQSSFHIGIETLNKLIPEELRNKVILMHFENDDIIKLATSYGYNVANK